MAATLQPQQFSCRVEQGPSGAVIAPRGELDLARHARADGVELELVPGSELIMRIFELTGTRDVLPFRRAS